MFAGSRKIIAPKTFGAVSKRVEVDAKCLRGILISSSLLLFALLFTACGQRPKSITLVSEGETEDRDR